ncbi:MAG TPA: hypothetical protein VM939_00420 [Gemmatimonadaceae bacterium]|nr:hypothetical protein [Gemmatimonadaceae bacterium]
MTKALTALTFIILAILAFRGVRLAYILFIAFGLAYFPIRAGFELSPRACQLVFGVDLAAFSLTNYAHIVLFALFFLMSAAQLNAGTSLRTTFIFSAVTTLTMGALVEIAQGVTGAGNCRLRDLIPDSAGVILGAAVLLGWRGARRALDATG